MILKIIVVMVIVLLVTAFGISCYGYGYTKGREEGEDYMINYLKKAFGIIHENDQRDA